VPAARAQEAVQVRFDLTNPRGGPFPADRFTVPDLSQLTGLRVDLPKPDCSVRPSDCNDIDVLNTLDGFNLQPRLSIPFTGPIDPATVSTDTVFLFKLGCLISSCPGDIRVRINQVVWDPATNALYAESDQLLDQDARYLLVITDGIRDPSGERIDSDRFHDVLHSGQTNDPAEAAYRQALLDALDQLHDATGMPPGQVAAASLFTTASATALLEKIRDQLAQATPAPADFLLGSNGERTVFPLANVKSLAFRRQVGTDLTDPNSFSSAPVSLASLKIVREAPDAVGTIAFGKYSSPDYENNDGVIPTVGTATGTPAVQGTNDVYFNLLLPSGTEPAGGWPVVIAGHGDSGNKNQGNVPLAVAAKLAQHGLATLAPEIVGHGGGSHGTLTVTKSDGSTVTLSAGGRGVDRNGDHQIGADEGLFTSPDGAQAIVFARDGLAQTVVDLLQLVRVIQVGVDVNGDSVPDLDPSRIYYFGASLGGVYGGPFVALEPSVRAAVFNASGGTLIDNRRLTRRGDRATVGQLLGGCATTDPTSCVRLPSLLNGGPDPLLPTNPLPFNENLPLRNVPPVVNGVPGAIAIQDELERIEWATQASSPVAFAPYLRTAPLAGNPRSVLYTLAKGDWVVANPVTASVFRAGDLADRATLYRFDLAYTATKGAIGTNPHDFAFNFTQAGIGPALQAQEQAATFFVSDGQQTIDPDGSGLLFETPILGTLPESLCFLPSQFRETIDPALELPCS
jgi:dienelactone hydrolase